MSISKSWKQKQNNHKSKTQLTYEVLTKLQETLDAYGITRQEKAYGKLLRICVQNKTQLEKIIDIIEIILDTKKINIVEVVFPHGANKHKKNGFMLYIKGSPHEAIQSIFAQTDEKWKITIVEYERLLENNNSNVSENGGNGGNSNNGRNGQLQNDQFFETQYEAIVQNAMKEMGIGRNEAEDHIYMWFYWKTQPNVHSTFADYSKHQRQLKKTHSPSPASSTFSSFFGGNGNNGERQIVDPFIPNELQNSENKNYRVIRKQQGKRKQNQSYQPNPNQNDSTTLEVQNSLKQANTLFENSPEAHAQNLFHDESGPENGEVNTHFTAGNENRSRCCPGGFQNFFLFFTFCLKSFILLSLTILLYVLYTDEKRSSIFQNNFQKIFQ